MDIELYVYDLSKARNIHVFWNDSQKELTSIKGLARKFSYNLTGVHIDAIYHTSLVFGGVEYFFGQGIHRKIPGSTHHGKPIEVIHMGKTELPMDVVSEYIDSLARVYTTESYDLFLHNCNNFTQDLSMFLVGNDIPETIRTLPQRFLETPIGQMLKGQIDQSMRSMTQAPDADMSMANRPPSVLSNGALPPNRVEKPASAPIRNGIHGASQSLGRVHNATTIQEIQSLLDSASKSCAVIFFTSATCAPCKIVYPAYDELAAEAGHRAVLMKVDLNQAYAVSSKYQVRATPTFMTFLKGEKENEWSGANEAQLRGNVQLLVQMAWPVHPHRSLRLPTFQRKITEPVTFKKIPPLDKLAAKIGHLSEEDGFAAIISYVKTREASGQIEAPMPNLRKFADILALKFKALPPEIHFAVIDLVRIAAADSRVSGYFATEKDLLTILTLIPPRRDTPITPYNLQVVTLQLACNLFTSPLFVEQLTGGQRPDLLRMALENLASSCLLAKHSNARFLASALVYNLALFDHNERLEDLPDKLKVSSMDNLEAALFEAVINERESKETLHGLLLALGMLLYSADVRDSTWELCRTMDVREALQEKSKLPIFTGEPLLQEVGEELLGKGDKK
jgi:desumoylating isopeptidase 1